MNSARQLPTPLCQTGELQNLNYCMINKQILMRNENEHLIGLAPGWSNSRDRRAVTVGRIQTKAGIDLQLEGDDKDDPTNQTATFTGVSNYMYTCACTVCAHMCRTATTIIIDRTHPPGKGTQTEVVSLCSSPTPLLEMMKLTFCGATFCTTITLSLDNLHTRHSDILCHPDHIKYHYRK